MSDRSEGFITYWERVNHRQWRKRRVELRVCRDPAICSEGIGYATWAEGRYLGELDHYGDDVMLAFTPKEPGEPRFGRVLYEQGA